MRIISGSKKGHYLKAPRNLKVRPTTDRAKKIIFDVLENINFLDDLVLDLFAGTGSLGIEALSRGAKEAIFVESNLKVVEVLKSNLESTGFIQQARILSIPVQRAIKYLQNENIRCQLIIADPPYKAGVAVQTLKLVQEAGILKKNGWMVIEHSSKEMLPQNVGSLVQKINKKIGDSAVSFYQNERSE